MILLFLFIKNFNTDTFVVGEVGSSMFIKIMDVWCCGRTSLMKELGGLSTWHHTYLEMPDFKQLKLTHHRVFKLDHNQKLAKYL